MPDRRLCVIVAKTWWVDLRSGETVTACGGGGSRVSRLSASTRQLNGVPVCVVELRRLPRAAAGSGSGVYGHPRYYGDCELRARRGSIQLWLWLGETFEVSAAAVNRRFVRTRPSTSY